MTSTYPPTSSKRASSVGLSVKRPGEINGLFCLPPRKKWVRLPHRAYSGLNFFRDPSIPHTHHQSHMLRNRASSVGLTVKCPSRICGHPLFQEEVGSTPTQSLKHCVWTPFLGHSDLIRMGYVPGDRDYLTNTNSAFKYSYLFLLEYPSSVPDGNENFSILYRPRLAHVTHGLPNATQTAITTLRRTRIQVLYPRVCSRIRQ